MIMYTTACVGFSESEPLESLRPFQAFQGEKKDTLESNSTPGNFMDTSMQFDEEKYAN